MEEKKQTKIVQLIALIFLALLFIFVFLTFQEIKDNPCGQKTCGEISNILLDKKCFLYKFAFEPVNISDLNITNQSNGVLQK